jgi:hypothetical protein
VNDPSFRVLCEGISRASGYAGGVFTGTAGDSCDQYFVHTDCTDAAAVGVKFTGFRVRADIFTQLASDTEFRVADDIFIF